MSAIENEIPSVEVSREVVGACRNTTRVKALLRTANPAEEAASASRRLIQVVAEWDEGASLDIVMGSRHARRGVEISFTQGGVAQPDWYRDLQWALAELAVLTAPRAPALDNWAPVSVLELRAARELDIPLLPTEATEWGTTAIDTLAESIQRQRNNTPWPVGIYTTSQTLVGFLAEDPTLRVRIQLSAATNVEIQMVNDALRSTWTRADSDLHDYQGRAVRMRTYVASSRGSVPARFRALVQQWGQNLRLHPHLGDEARTLWDGIDPLAGHAVPEGMALAMLHFPAAGSTSVPGIPTQYVKAVAVPLDPVPMRPKRPVRLGRATTVGGASIELSMEVTDFLRHMSVEGAPGAGKSTLLTQIARGLAEIGCGFTVLEGHGATVDAIERALPAHALERVSVVRHGDLEHPVGLDILSGDPAIVERNIDVFAEMIQQMYDPLGEGFVGPRWRRWFGLVALATFILFGKQASLVHVTAIASDMRRVNQLARRVMDKNPEVGHRLAQEYGALDDKEASAMVSWGVSKLHPAVSSTALRAILGTGHDAVDVRELMEERRGLLIDLAMPTLGIPGARLLGAMWLMKHWLALGERSNRDEPHILIVDEAHLFAYGALPNMLAEARKFGVGVVVASQSIDALHPNLKNALDANSGSFISLRSGLRDAVRASARLNGWPVEKLVRLPDLTAAATVSRDGIMSEPFTLTIDHHQRMKKIMRPEQAETQATQLEERSLRELWEPYRGLTSPTDAEIVSALEPQRPPQPKRPAPHFMDERWESQANRATAVGPAHEDAAAPARVSKP